MRSLRSLCLLQVHSMGQNVLDMSEIPANLAKDLKIIQLVNKTFGNWTLATNDVSTKVYQTALSIQYDGVSWNFQYCSNSYEVFCCPHCDFRQPDLKQFTLQEGKPAPVQSPFWEASNILEQLNQEHPVDRRMTMSFEMNEEGTWGKISFRGSEDFAVVPVIFSSNIVVKMNEAGQRKLYCDGLVERGMVQHGFQKFLIETAVAVEDAFSSPVHPFCYLLISEDETSNEEDPEDFMEDFWRFVGDE
eukprot:GFUD01139444.1.p1 GENE.GFUD01139444.1~~GFUD01139444.1.p1  ORF type:complete len:246 (+),score=67.72 GFUD01139444.1:67-804(+)